jgi:hypothetical protein
MTIVTAALKAMKVGTTKVLWDNVVTRWTEDKFEIGTFGRGSLTITDAAEAIEKSRN